MLYLNLDKRQSLRKKRQLKTLLKKLRRREQTIRNQMTCAHINTNQHRTLQIEAAINNQQRRKGLTLLKTFIQDLRS